MEGTEHTMTRKEGQDNRHAIRVPVKVNKRKTFAHFLNKPYNGMVPFENRWTKSVSYSRLRKCNIDMP